MEKKRFCTVCGKETPVNLINIEGELACKECANKLIAEKVIDDVKPIEENVPHGVDIKQKLMNTSQQNEQGKSSNSYKGIYFAIFIIIGLLLASIGGCFDSGSPKSGTQPISVEELYERTYQKAIELIQKKDFKGASEFMAHSKLMDDKYKNSEILFRYVSAEVVKNDATYSKIFLDKIPLDYQGEFKDEIKLLREEVDRLIIEQRPAMEKKKQEEEARKAEEVAKQKERNSKIYVGDPEGKIITVFGQPRQVNKTVIGNSVHKQYVYGNGHYIYTEDGVVTGFQSSD